MSRPGNPDAAEPGQARQYRAPAGLLEKLMAAVRPEFRADDLVFDPRDPVFGGPACAVGGCARPHRKRGLCVSHWQRWRASGRPGLAEFTATAEAGWHGHLPLGSCVIEGCNYGRTARGMCHRHARQWYYAGRPGLAGWQDSPAPLPPPDCPPPDCRIGYCSLWAQGTSAFCLGHDNRWKGNGRPGVEEFTASCEKPGPGHEHIDLRRLPAGLRLEVQYVLQCRGDERAAMLPPREVQPLVAALAAAGASSLLEQPEEWWAGRDAPRHGRGWRTLQRFPAGAPVLFPRQTRNLDGRRPMSCHTYRSALSRWLEDCDIRDEHGRPVHLTPHQWRHTLGTVLINRDVPQHVVQKILDHDSPHMTAHYARLSGEGHYRSPGVPRAPPPAAPGRGIPHTHRSRMGRVPRPLRTAPGRTR